MARNENVTCDANVWTELTNADCDFISFQIQNIARVVISATAGPDQPVNDDGFTYQTIDGREDMDLAKAFRGIAAVRLWAKPNLPCTIFVSHSDV